LSGGGCGDAFAVLDLDGTLYQQRTVADSLGARSPLQIQRGGSLAEQAARDCRGYLLFHAVTAAELVGFDQQLEQLSL